MSPNMEKLLRTESKLSRTRTIDTLKRKVQVNVEEGYRTRNIRE